MGRRAETGEGSYEEVVEFKWRRLNKYLARYKS